MASAVALMRHKTEQLSRSIDSLSSHFLGGKSPVLGSAVFSLLRRIRSRSLCIQTIPVLSHSRTQTVGFSVGGLPVYWRRCRIIDVPAAADSSSPRSYASTKERIATPDGKLSWVTASKPLMPPNTPSGSRHSSLPGKYTILTPETRRRAARTSVAL